MSEEDAAKVADALLAVMGELRQHWRRHLRPWDLSPHHARALRTIGQHSPLRSSDLAERLAIAPRSATEVVDALVERGLAHREPDPGDRRAVHIDLTEQGRAVHEEILAAREAAMQEFFGALQTQERSQLIALLQRLL